MITLYGKNVTFTYCDRFTNTVSEEVISDHDIKLFVHFNYRKKG